MSVTREELAAYADGELAEADMARIAEALAVDPDLRGQLEAHRRLKAMLSAHYDPLLAQDVPTTLVEAVARGAEAETATVVDFADAKAARASLAESTAPRRLPRWSYLAGPALAASLVAVAVFSLRGGPDAPTADGYADARLARVLDEQLVAEQSQRADTRILLSFRDGGGHYCRAFSGSAQSGIACRDDTGWELRQLGIGGEAASTDYRQAGASQSELMAAAQAMAVGGALDAEEEAEARRTGWR